MKTIQSFIAHQIRQNATIEDLIGNYPKTYLLFLLNQYLLYCLSNPDRAEEKDSDQNIIVPLNFFLKEFAHLYAYYEALLRLHASANRAPISTLKVPVPAEEEYQLKAATFLSTLNAVNLQIIHQVKQAVGQYRYEISSVGKGTHPRKFPYYILGTMLGIGLYTGLIRAAFEFQLISSFSFMLSIPVIAMVGVLAVFIGSALYAHYGFAKWRTAPWADELEDRLIDDEVSSSTHLPEHKLEHAWYSYNNERLFYTKKKIVTNKIKTATTPTYEVDNELEHIEEMVTHNTLLTHYRNIYPSYEKYKEGKGLLETGYNENPYGKRNNTAFCTTPIDKPRVNIASLQKETNVLKRKLGPSTFHSIIPTF